MKRNIAKQQLRLELNLILLCRIIVYGFNISGAAAAKND
jgi:hypothetical protein